MTPTKPLLERLRELNDTMCDGPWKSSAETEYTFAKIFNPYTALIAGDLTDNNAEGISMLRSILPEIIDLLSTLDEKLTCALSAIQHYDAVYSGCFVTYIGRPTQFSGDCPTKNVWDIGDMARITLARINGGTKEEV